MGKAVLIDKRAEKELKKFSQPVQLKFQALFEILEEDGKLEEPFGKKLSGRRNLFEIRVRQDLIILCALVKKTQKTPIMELEKAIKRLADY